MANEFDLFAAGSAGSPPGPDAVMASVGDLPVVPAVAAASEPAGRRKPTTPAPAAHRTTASFSVAGEAYDRLANHASRRGVTVGIAARDLALQKLRELDEQAELAHNVNGRTELLHTQMAAMERRVGATVASIKDRQADVHSDVQLLMLLVDTLLTTYLLHTPAVPEATEAERQAKRQQAASAKERYNKLLTVMARKLQDGASVRTAIQAANLGI